MPSFDYEGMKERIWYRYFPCWGNLTTSDVSYSQLQEIDCTKDWMKMIDTYRLLKKELKKIESDVKITDIVVSDISKNIVISFEIEVNEKWQDFQPKIYKVIQWIQDIGKCGYGLYLDLHNSGNFTLATMSFSEDVIHNIDLNKHPNLNLVFLETLSTHFSVPKGLR